MDDPLIQHAVRICPNPDCQYDKHEEGANFCILCGTLLYRQCDDCLKENPRYARYCYYCGTDLEWLREERSKNQKEERFFREDAPSEADEMDEDTGASRVAEDEGEEE